MLVIRRLVLTPLVLTLLTMNIMLLYKNQQLVHHLRESVCYLKVILILLYHGLQVEDGFNVWAIIMIYARKPSLLTDTRDPMLLPIETNSALGI